MTRSKPFGHDCPCWHEGISPAQERAFRVAMRAAILAADRHVAESQIATEAIREWHRLMFEFFVPLDYYAGNFRQDDSRRICLGQDVMVAGIAGVPFHRVVQHMDKLIEEAAITLSRTELHWSFFSPADRAKRLAVIVAKLIGTFIRIHPFVNGNGRVSRLIWRWSLQRFGFNSQVRIAPRPAPPYDTVMSCCMNGDDRPLALLIMKHIANSPVS